MRATNAPRTRTGGGTSRSRSHPYRSSSPTCARSATTSASRGTGCSRTRNGTSSRTWARTLQGPGVLVLAQPLFDHEGGKTDRSLASFEKDFARLCAVFEESLTRGDGRDAHDILILTGDIHTGRLAVATIVGVPSANVYEFVASPASRVGPFVMKASPKHVPDRFTVEHDKKRSLWQVSDLEFAATIDNNVGLVRISPGTNGRCRFELELWRVRPHDDRSFWQRVRRKGQPQAPVRAASSARSSSSAEAERTPMIRNSGQDEERRRRRLDGGLRRQGQQRVLRRRAGGAEEGEGRQRRADDDRPRRAARSAGGDASPRAGRAALGPAPEPLVARVPHRGRRRQGTT